jgi:hypothetical protein
MGQPLQSLAKDDVLFSPEIHLDARARVSLRNCLRENDFLSAGSVRCVKELLPAGVPNNNPNPRVLVSQPCRDDPKGSDPQARDAEPQGQPLSLGDPNSRPGEGPRPHPGRDTIHTIQSDPSLDEHILHHAKKALCLLTGLFMAGITKQPSRPGVASFDNRNRTSFAGRFKSQNSHATPSPFFNCPLSSSCFCSL